MDIDWKKWAKSPNAVIAKHYECSQETVRKKRIQAGVAQIPRGGKRARAGGKYKQLAQGSESIVINNLTKKEKKDLIAIHRKMGGKFTDAVRRVLNRGKSSYL